MILPRAQAKRFFLLFDYLTIYAHRRLQVVSSSELFNGEPPRGISMDGMRLTMRDE